LQFGACFILVSSSPHTLSTDMLFGALGIISKTVTEPYWRYAGHSDRNALNMGSIYEQLIDLYYEQLC
jgi:hypothetical protein